MIWIAFDLPMSLIILHYCCKSKYALRPRPLDCWNKFECNVCLLIGLALVVAFFWLDWAPVIIGSRNIWPIYKLAVSFSAPSPFFITFVLPQMCWRLELFFAAAWLGLFASICIFVAVHICFCGCSLLWLALVRLHLSTRSLWTCLLGLHNVHIKWINVWGME